MADPILISQLDPAPALSKQEVIEIDDGASSWKLKLATFLASIDKQDLATVIASLTKQDLATVIASLTKQDLATAIASLTVDDLTAVFNALTSADLPAITIPEKVAELQDVEHLTPTDMQALVYVAALNKWRPTSLTPSGDIATTRSLGDVKDVAATDGQILVWDDNLKLWQPTKNSPSPLTTKGDLYGFGTDNARIPVGTDGQVLSAASSEALGVKWVAQSGGGGGTSYFSGATGQPGAYSSSAFASKGAVVVLSSGITVTAVGAIVDPYDAGQDIYYGAVCEVDAANKVISTPATTPSVTAVSAKAYAMRFVFPSPVSFLAGDRVAVLLCRAAGGRSDTTCPAVASTPWAMNLPGDTLPLFIRSTNRTPLLNETFDFTYPSVPFAVWLEGGIT